MMRLGRGTGCPVCSLSGFQILRVEAVFVKGSYGSLILSVRESERDWCFNAESCDD